MYAVSNFYILTWFATLAWSLADLDWPSDQTETENYDFDSLFPSSHDSSPLSTDVTPNPSVDDDTPNLSLDESSPALSSDNPILLSSGEFSNLSLMDDNTIDDSTMDDNTLDDNTLDDNTIDDNTMDDNTIGDNLDNSDSLTDDDLTSSLLADNGDVCSSDGTSLPSRKVRSRDDHLCATQPAQGSQRPQLPNAGDIRNSVEPADRSTSTSTNSLMRGFGYDNICPPNLKPYPDWVMCGMEWPSLMQTSLGSDVFDADICEFLLLLQPGPALTFSTLLFLYDRKLSQLRSI